MWNRIQKQSPTVILMTQKSINMFGPEEAAAEPLLTLLVPPVFDQTKD